MLKWIVDRMHCSSTDEDVKAEILKRVARARKAGAEISEDDVNRWVAKAIEIHHENQSVWRMFT